MTGIDMIVEQVRGSPLAMANVALTLLLPRGDGDRARALCDEALAMAPDDGEIRTIRAEVLSAGVEDWYFNMVRDEVRHAAVDRALSRALQSGGRVLDIGTGAGLFAMMAARAGADEVISCERDAVVAEAAQAIVACNGLQDRVKVVVKASTDVSIGIDMAGPADLLVWDNVGSDLVGLGTAPVIEDAMRRLVKPGGSVVPARCAIKAALAEDMKLGRRRMGFAAGFDLTPFNALAKPAYLAGRGPKDLAMRSSATTLFDFDFRTGGPFRSQKGSNPVVGEGGPANGVVQWLEFAMDEHEVYSSGPGVPYSAFGLVFHPSRAAFEAETGKTFEIVASHDRARLRIWLKGD